MKRVFLAALAAVAVAGVASAIEPEPIETHPIPDRGTIYPPPTPGNLTPDPIDIIIGDDGEFVTNPPGWDIPSGDNSFKTAFEAMMKALETARALIEVQADIETHKALVNAALREMSAEIEANKCKCEPGSSSDDITLYYDSKAELTDAGALTIGIDVHFEGQQAEFKEHTVNFAKIAKTGRLKDAADYQACYDEARGDWMATILSYHDGQATETVVSNFHPVAFSGDYDSLTNTPTLKVEEDGEGYKLSLATGGAEEENSGSLPVVKIASTGSWNDLKDIPENATNCYTKAETDAKIDEKINAHHSSCDHGGGGGTVTNIIEGAVCDCQIKTVEDVVNNEQDPVWTQDKPGIESQLDQLQKDMKDASTKIEVLENKVGGKATVGVMEMP